MSFSPFVVGVKVEAGRSGLHEGVGRVLFVGGDAVSASASIRLSALTSVWDGDGGSVVSVRE
jgi:hypothetical protein